MVQKATPPMPTATPTNGKPLRLESLKKQIEHVGHLLPAQGPITVFVHHNTLHALEDLPFDEAVVEGARIFGCAPYRPEQWYRRGVDQGRIRSEDLVAVLREEMRDQADQRVLAPDTRLQLRLAMLEYPLRIAPEAELRWYVAEADALRKMCDHVPAPTRERFLEETRHWVMRDLRRDWENGRRPPHNKADHPSRPFDDLFRHFGASSMESWSPATWEAFALRALWRVCCQGVHTARPAPAEPVRPLRHRDLLKAATAEDSDALVLEFLVRFCAAFLDQGLAHWQLPERPRGFYESFLALYGRAGGPPDRWLRGLRTELNRLRDEGRRPLESVLESLELLGVPPDEWETFLASSLLALRGWAGMIRQMEIRQDRAAWPAPAGSLVEYLAVQLILERFALRFVARQAWGESPPLDKIRSEARRRLRTQRSPTVEQRAFVVFQLAQARGWHPGRLSRLAADDWKRLMAEIESFTDLDRRRVYHAAYERNYRTRSLDAVAVHAGEEVREDLSPAFQVICCIDDREESFRRHIEELEPRAETLGAAGFFNIAMYYRGAADAHFVPLCPVVIRPQHYVQEEAVYTLEETHRRRARTRRVLGTASHQFHIGTRSFAGGAMLAALLGPLASIPLVARTLFPRLTARIRRFAGSLVRPPQITRLRLERTQSQPGPADEQLGYTVDEMAEIVERLLRDMGLTSRFARLVVVTGHGSASMNNPHNAAYDCGACGGGRGGPNARAFALMANDPRIRQRLARRGLAIPAEAVFLGAYHNTCDDHVAYYDLDRLPASHRPDFERAREVIERACERNAHERCRRFESAPLGMSPESALRHVEGRAEDLAQTRPECGHATNALCIVGRRARTRGLFLDRRAFLTSYDPTLDDDEHTILTRLLQAVVPVCAGINLEYYFSYTDPAGWGCGTKLPHNIASLLGVMDGAASDLRPGLPWQMVEIHEPMRLLFIIETRPEVMAGIIERQPAIAQLCLHRWVQLATLDPESSQIHHFHHGRFVPYRPAIDHLPQVDSSVDWYRGWRDHLGFAQVRTPVASAAESSPPESSTAESSTAEAVSGGRS